MKGRGKGSQASALIGYTKSLGATVSWISVSQSGRKRDVFSDAQKGEKEASKGKRTRG